MEHPQEPIVLPGNMGLSCQTKPPSNSGYSLAKAGKLCETHHDDGENNGDFIMIS